MKFSIAYCEPNSIRIFTDGNGTHYQDEHTCPGQTCREIRVSYDPDGAGGHEQYQVWYQTVGASWQHTDINYGETSVRGKIYEVHDWNQFIYDDYGQEEAEYKRRYELPDTVLRMVREVVVPATEPGTPARRFSFMYNSDAAEFGSVCLVRHSLVLSST